MAEISIESWIIVILLFGFMGLSFFNLGVLAIQIIFRRRSRQHRKSYEKWGVEADLFRPNSSMWFALRSVAVVVGTALMGLVAFLFTALLIEETLPRTDQLYYTIMVALYALFVGLLIESNRIRRITEMTGKLDDLREVFHQRFSVSELLSMYENLRPTPPLFWEEYANLRDHEIKEDTNRRYRRRATPYSNIQFGKYSRIIIVVAVLTLGLTGASALMQLLR